MQVLLSSQKQALEPSCGNVSVVTAITNGEGAWGKHPWGPLLQPCGSQRAVQTAVRVRAVAHAVSAAFPCLVPCSVGKDHGVLYSTCTGYTNKQRFLCLGVSATKVTLFLFFLQSDPVQGVISCFISTVLIIES